MTAYVQKTAQAILLALCLCLAGAAYLFRKDAVSSSQALADLNAQVAQQSLEAEKLLLTLTAERDAKQAELDAYQAEQERKDAYAQLEIARLTHELEHRPIRVRYLQPASGQGSGGSKDQSDTHPQTGGGHGAETHGVLPEENARSLKQVIAEAEGINAAYASCRAQLFALDSALR